MIDIISAKIEGKEISTPTPREEKVIDLMEALKASLELAEKEKTDKSPKRGRKKKVAGG